MRKIMIAIAVAAASAAWLSQSAAAPSSAVADAQTAPAGVVQQPEGQSGNCYWIIWGGRWWCIPY
jgi:hypothetical protein